MTPPLKNEQIENIAQKSIIGGGAISTRYQAAKEIGDLIAKDVLSEFSKGASEVEIGRLFFESLGNARGAFEATKNQLYKNVDDILIRKGAKTTEVIPVNTLKNTLDDIRSLYTEGGMPDVLAQRLGNITKNIEARAAL